MKKDENMKKTKILVIEDTESIREELRDILGFERMEVITAENGQLGIDAAKKHQPDLILCDIMMPVKDGFQVFNEIKQVSDLKYIPFVFLTAKSTNDDARQGMILGADDYINKPFSVDSLIDSLKSQLKKSGKRIEQEKRKRELEDLINIVCHDVANPLNVIMGHLTILERNISKLDDEILKKKLIDSQTRCQTSGKHISDIIENIRDMKSLEDGKMTLSISEIDLVEAINDGLDVVKERIQNKQITVVIKNNTRNPLTSSMVMADKTSLINSVLVNVFTNAIKFSDQKGEILIFLDETDFESSVIIKDFGVGIPEALLENIFNPSIATSRLGTDGEKGTGFGLPIVSLFMSMYGGRIGVKSNSQSETNEECGTTFTLSFNKTSNES
jgi:two-component system sensor kinase